jgi:hypothetical protein
MSYSECVELLVTCIVRMNFVSEKSKDGTKFEDLGSDKMILLLLLLFINCNWAYARWQCYKNWTYIQEMDIHSKETKHTSHEKTA